MIERNPHLLDRKAVLEVYAAITNRSISDAVHQALVHEIFEHIDAQGRLVAQAGNVIEKFTVCSLCGRKDWPVDPTTGWRCGDSFHAAKEILFEEIKRAMV